MLGGASCARSVTRRTGSGDGLVSIAPQGPAAAAAICPPAAAEGCPPRGELDSRILEDAAEIHLEPYRHENVECRGAGEGAVATFCLEGALKNASCPFLCRVTSGASREMVSSRLA